MKNLLVIVFTLLVSMSAFSADNIYTRKNYPQPRLLDNSGRVWPVAAMYTTDGSSNVVPLGTAKTHGEAVSGGVYSGVSAINLVGYASGIGASSVDIWEASGTAAAYVFPASPIQMAVVSDNAADATGSTGAITVQVDYLNNLGVAASEVVVMNGVTPVSTVATNINRVNGFTVISAGTGKKATGNIALTSVGGATVYSKISAGEASARQLIYSVPAGKTLYLSGYHLSSASATAGSIQQFHLESTNKGSVVTPGIFIDKMLNLSVNSATHGRFIQPLAIPAGADVKASVFANGANSAFATYALDGWLE